MPRANFNPRAREWLVEAGYDPVAKVEYFNDHTKRFHDLFGAFDFLGVGVDHTVGVQVCRRSDMANRRTKMRANPHVATVLERGWKVLLLGYDQPKGRGTAWRVKVEQFEPLVSA